MIDQFLTIYIKRRCKAISDVGIYLKFVIIITGLFCLNAKRQRLVRTSLWCSDRSMKVLLIGNSGVGKSNLLTRFAVFNF